MLRLAFHLLLLFLVLSLSLSPGDYPLRCPLSCDHSQNLTQLCAAQLPRHSPSPSAVLCQPPLEPQCCGPGWSIWGRKWGRVNKKGTFFLMSRGTYRNWGDPAEISPQMSLQWGGWTYQRRADTVREGAFSSWACFHDFQVHVRLSSWEDRPQEHGLARRSTEGHVLLLQTGVFW